MNFQLIFHYLSLLRKISRSSRDVENNKADTYCFLCLGVERVVMEIGHFSNFFLSLFSTHKSLITACVLFPLVLSCKEAVAGPNLHRITTTR